jgi:hypothetical protein
LLQTVGAIRIARGPNRAPGRDDTASSETGDDVIEVTERSAIRDYDMALLLDPSSAAEYLAVVPVPPTVTNRDDDVAGFRVEPLECVTTEGSTAIAAFAVNLHTIPTSTVTIPVTSLDPTEGAVRLTYHSANDRWPDIFIPGSAPAAGDPRGGTARSETILLRAGRRGQRHRESSS